MTGGGDLTFTLKDGMGNRLTPSVINQASLGDVTVTDDVITYTPTAGSFSPFGDRDQFRLGIAGAAVGCNLFLAQYYPEFTVPNDRPYYFGASFFKQQFFWFSQEEVSKIKFTRPPFHGQMILEGRA